MSCRRFRLTTMFMFAALVVPSMNFASADEDQPTDKAPKKMVIQLKINGEDFKITNLEELKKHAETLKGHVDVDRLTKMFHGEGDGEMQFRVQGMPQTVSLGKYMIGLMCQDVDESLRSQLNLGDGGLIVLEAMPDTPAAKAGIEKFDVLTKADDAALDSLPALIEAVDRAGAANKPLTLIVIRKGQEKSVEITPQERPDRPEWTIDLSEDVEEHAEHAEDGDRKVIILRQKKQADEGDDQGQHSAPSSESAELRELRAQVKELRAIVESLKKKS